MSTLHAFLKEAYQAPVIALTVVAFIVCNLLFGWRQKKLGHQHATLDARLWYTPTMAADLFKAWGRKGRRLYAVTEVTLDVVYPLVYGTLFAILLAQLYRSDWPATVPLAAVLFDLLENSTAAFLAWSYRGSQSQLVWLALAFTLAKFTFICVTLVLLVWGGATGLWGT